jgi:hypothetical protein
MGGAPTREEARDAVRALLLAYRDECVEPTWELPDVRIEFEGPEIRIFDTERTQLAAGRMSAPLLLAGAFARSSTGSTSRASSFLSS